MSNDLVLSEAGLLQITCIVFERQLRLFVHVVRLSADDPACLILSCRDPRCSTEGAPTRFMFASGGILSEGYGHGGRGNCMGDGQTEAEGVLSRCGRGDSLLRRMTLCLT